MHMYDITCRDIYVINLALSAQFSASSKWSLSHFLSFFVSLSHTHVYLDIHLLIYERVDLHRQADIMTIYMYIYICISIFMFVYICICM